MISSTANPTIKRLALLHERRGRLQAGHYLVEGIRLVEEALDCALPPQTLIVAPDLLRTTARGRALYDRLQHQHRTPESLEVTPGVLRHLAGTETPAGIIAALPLPAPLHLDRLPDVAGLVLVLDGLQDPGNAGTILRSADAAGVDAVVALRGCVDLFAPKVVRAGMGAHLRLPIAADIPVEDLATWLQTSPPRQALLADAHATDTIYELDLRGATVLIIGGEAHGAAQAGNLADIRRVAIPMPGRAESLNAAAAAAILLFEAVRQRRPLFRILTPEP